MDDHVELFRLLPDERARCRLVEIYLPMALRLARRYIYRGIERDDLEQVASLGLLHAIDRFDPERGIPFVRYAVPTIVGELKRHFRDAGWGVRVPRSLKDLNAESRRVNEELTQQLGRVPTIAELAEALGADPGDVAEAAAAWTAFRPDALDASRSEDGPTVGETLGSRDASYDLVENLDVLGPILASRPERERRALYLRFYHDYSQREIAAELGISQMHVSRILSTSLEKLQILMTA